MESSQPRPERLILLLLILLMIGAVAWYVVTRNTGSVLSSDVARATPTVGTVVAPVISEAPGAVCHARGVLPDPICTPGAADPNVTQANIAQTICVPGYTKTVRPAVSYTNKLKVTQMAQYGFGDSLKLHEEDHLISLELGGSPTDPKNLWPEPGQSPNPKDKIENALHDAVCAGRMSLAEAQHRIATDWTTALTN